MRLLLLLLIVAVAACYTNPPRAQFETEARAELQAQAEIARNDPQARQAGLSLDDMVGYAKGMMAGQGAYENYYVASKYSIDMPGPDFLECYGAFTLVKCQVRRS